MSRFVAVALSVLLLAACRSTQENVPSATPIPAAAAPLELGLAGAPVSLFGPDTAPTFEQGFQRVADAGFDFFFPLFVVTETDDASTYSAHGMFFFPPSLSGAPVEGSCAGPHDPYAAAEGRVRIWYPGVQLLGLFDLTEPLPPSTLESALAAQRSECPSSATVAAFYAFDEISVGRVVAGYLGQPQLLHENVETVARVVRESWAVPMVSVENPGELALRGVGLSQSEADRVVEEFWADARSVAAVQDTYGFNVYPVPGFALTLPGDYVRHARSVAPTQRVVSVLQGMSFAGITGDPARGRAPTLDETRFQAIDSIAGGADALVWYGASSLDLANLRDAQLWADLGIVAAELRSVREAVTGEPVAVPETEGLWIRAHRAGDELVVFVSHRASAPAARQLAVGPEWTTVEAVAGPTPTRDADGWTVDMGALDAAILRFR